MIKVQITLPVTDLDTVLKDGKSGKFKVHCYGSTLYKTYLSIEFEDEEEYIIFKLKYNVEDIPQH